MFEKEKESFLYSVTIRLEENQTRKTLVKLFFVGISGNILSWLIAFFTPVFVGDFVAVLVDIEGKVGLYLLIIPFSFAFLSAFSILKITRKPFQNSQNDEGAFFDKYFHNSRADDYRKIFLMSAAFGGLNSILLALAIIFFR